MFDALTVGSEEKNIDADLFTKTADMFIPCNFITIFYKTLFIFYDIIYATI